VFWEEEDGIVLLDYKTDRVDSEEELVVRYEKQLQLYKSAIEHAYGVPVKEVLIYSFALERSFDLCTTK
jgi:ATP-dependent helicase/nuclease subunit A